MCSPCRTLTSHNNSQLTQLDGNEALFSITFAKKVVYSMKTYLVDSTLKSSEF
jgi:hypothetical protein